MPKLFRAFGLLFHFYSNEHEPIHVHVDGKGTKNKYDVENKEWVKAQAKLQDLKKAKNIIDAQSDEIINIWKGYFKTNK